MSLASIAVAQQTGTCSVEGTVTAAATGGPLAAAQVAFSDKARSEPPVVASTDENGHYVVDELEHGDYLVAATRRGYVTRMFGQRGKKIEGTSLACMPTSKLRGVNFRLISTGVISGRVLGEENEPRVGADVQAFIPRFVLGERRLLAAGHAVTNDLGEYRIYGLAPGRYYVSASEDNQHQIIRRPKAAPPDEASIPTLYPNATDLDHSAYIDVPAGGAMQGTDIVLQKARAFHIRGKIVGFDETARYTRVQLKAVGAPWELVASSGDIPPDTRGNFDFADIVPGSYVVSTILGRAGQFESDWRVVEVRSADINDVSLSPSSGVELQGRVRVEGDKKIELGSLTAYLANRYSPIQPSKQVNPDGTFLIRVFGRSSYRVGISNLPQDFYIKSVRAGDEETTAATVDLSSADDSAGAVEIVVSGNGGQIGGTVKNEHDEPVGGALVVLIPDASHRGEAGLFKEITADQDGHFTLRGIRPGNYKLFSWDGIEPGAWWDPEFLRHYEDKGQEINVEANGNYACELHLISVDGGEP